MEEAYKYKVVFLQKESGETVLFQRCSEQKAEKRIKSYEGSKIILKLHLIKHYLEPLSSL